MVAPVGPLATRNREPGQARKGAAAAVAVGAGVWLAGAASFPNLHPYRPAPFRTITGFFVGVTADSPAWSHRAGPPN